MNNLAWHYAMRGDDRAVELARQAHALAPENGSITDTLGWILAEKGSFAEAVPLLREAVQRLPDNAEVRFHLASALIGVGAKDEAKKILEGLLSSGQAFPSRSEAERISSSL